MKRSDLCEAIRRCLKRYPPPHQHHYGIVPPPPPERVSLGEVQGEVGQAIAALSRLETAWRAATGDVWPEKAVVHSCFPGYAHLYLPWEVWQVTPIRVRGYEPMLHHEARIAGGLRHPHIVGVLDVDVESNPPFLVLEYLVLILIISALVRALERKLGSDESHGRER